jgi:hypothetical protein
MRSNLVASFVDLSRSDRMAEPGIRQGEGKGMLETNGDCIGHGREDTSCP